MVAEGQKPGPHPVLQAKAALAAKTLLKRGFPHTQAHTECSTRLAREPELKHRATKLDKHNNEAMGSYAGCIT